MARIAITPYSQFRNDTILIGASCLADGHAHQTIDKDLQIINPYQSHDDIAKAAEYCWNVSIEYCGYLSKLMNRIHHVSYSPAYWKVILLPWMIAFVENLYDRYLRLCMVRENHQDAVIELPKVELSCPLYKRSFDVWSRAHLHSINIKIYSLIINLIGLDSSVKYLDIYNDDSKGNGHKIKLSNSFAFLKEPAKYLAKKLGISIKNGLSFSQRINWTDLDVSFIKDNGFAEQALNRSIIRFEHTNDEFKSILHNFVPWALPVSMFEEYKERRNIARIYLLKKKAKTAHISNTFWANDTLKFILAEIRESGGKIVGQQHGGGYGNFVIATPEKAEREMFDYFISWGWSDKRSCPAIPLPDPRLSRLHDIHRQRNQNILFIGSHGPMYMFRYQGYWMPEFAYQRYYPMKRMFFDKLKGHIRKCILYRPYLHEYGWHESERIKEILPDVNIENKSPISVMKSCSLVVIDHPSTSFLEAFVTNVPTILFWDNEQCPMREEAEPYFQLLRESGILYHNPEDAAEKVNAIWKDVQGWWQQTEVQKAKDEFCWQFARTSKNWRRDWAEFLKGLRGNE